LKKATQRITKLVGVFILGFISSCAPVKEEVIRSSNLPPEGSEIEVNTSPIVYSGPITNIYFRAQFERPVDWGSGTTQPLPIPEAEFWVYDSLGQIIQRGQTNSSGEAVFSLPQEAADRSVFISIHSRAKSTTYEVSVLNDPFEKKFYRIIHNLSVPANATQVGSSATPLKIIALFNDDAVTAAPFNLLYNVFITHQFLADRRINKLPKASIYWKKGFTPAQYFGSNGPISFFSPGKSLPQGLYILGGLNGNICGVDTDHFDNSVILHEYAHFIEHAVGRSDSPGGSHNGNQIIDPRLAWSEGWANFFQGAVLNRPNYIDRISLGCNRSSTSINYPLERDSPSETDQPQAPGEGSFREMAIARYLFSITRVGGTSSYQQIDIDFSLVWSAMQQLTNPQFIGRSIHHVNRYLASQSLPSEFYNNDKPFAYEKQSSNLYHWAHPLEEKTTACSDHPDLGVGTGGYWRLISGGPKADRNESNAAIHCGQVGEIAWSDMFNSNDFHVFYHNGGNRTLILEYEAESGGTPYDLDLYIYRSDFIHLDKDYIVRASERFYPEQSGQGRESVDLSGLPRGVYFINVKVDQGGCVRATTRYRLRLNTNYLCPKNDIQANY
jgi:hypothetical protein